MKQVHLIKLDWSTALVFESVKDATAAYEVFSKAQFSTQEYNGDTYINIPVDKNVELTKAILMDQKEFEASRETIRLRKEAEKAETEAA
jgi:hypothetical protein